MEQIPVIDWSGCYDDSWKGFITDDAFAHPAKFAPGLIDRIIAHGLREGWWKTGDLIGDCFGGVGCGGITAAHHNLRWVGVELESRFVDLARMNFAMRRKEFEAFGNPMPVIIQGDSRRFAEIVAASGIVTSPPYVSGGHHNDVFDAWNVNSRGQGIDKDTAGYGKTQGQIGALPAGQCGAVVTSPPYAESIKGDHGEKETAADSQAKRNTPGGSLGKSQRFGGYGAAEGNIGNLKEGVLDAGVTSPPFGFRLDGEYDKGIRAQHGGDSIERGKRDYHNYAASGTEGQIQGTETYWTAMRQVYEQCFIALKAGGVACIVVKDYVKDGARVGLCDDTLRLLLSVGFEPVCRIRAWLVTEKKTDGLFGETTKRTERKSFFRRLAEKKGAPRIDWEEVIVVRKPKEIEHGNE